MRADVSLILGFGIGFEFFPAAVTGEGWELFVDVGLMRVRVWQVR